MLIDDDQCNTQDTCFFAKLAKAKRGMPAGISKCLAADHLRDLIEQARTSQAKAAIQHNHRRVK